MARTKLDARFFDSTRGRIILHLRGSVATVNELANETSLTDNAVRAHLLSLERDGLVTQDGVTKGFRKPHFVYRLTDEARHLFPTPYHSLLNKLLSVLKNKLSPKPLLEALRDVGRGIANDNVASRDKDLNKRLAVTLSTLEDLGGAARVVRENDELRIESDSCPFADVVSEHPEVCKVSEALVAEAVGEATTEICDRTGLPKCRFQINVS
jgi:predicted ArsR family transcriptional regulator